MDVPQSQHRNAQKYSTSNGIQPAGDWEKILVWSTNYNDANQNINFQFVKNLIL